jgi:hypothetical protein
MIRVTGPLMSTGENFSQEQAQSMLARYVATLSELGCEPIPYPDLEAKVARSIVHLDVKRETLNHAMWMCEETAGFIRRGSWAKAHRWIGMIQALLFDAGVYSISDLKDHNRDVWPAPRPCRPDRQAY